MPRPLALPFYQEPQGIIRLSASAGAGKTYRLAQHYLKLLKCLSPPSEKSLLGIVALTFTNQAAAEMRERILFFLKNVALATSLGKELSAGTGLTPEEARAWLETIFSAYHAFQVRTIDSLLFTLIRGLALELGLRPELSAEIREEYFLNQAFDQLLFRLREDPTLEEVFVQALFTFLEIEGRGGFNPEFHFRRRLRDIYKLCHQKLGARPLSQTLDQKHLWELEESLRAQGQALWEKLQARGASLLYGWGKHLQDPSRFFWSKLFQKDSLRQALPKGFRELAEELDPDFQALKETREKYLWLKAQAEVEPYLRLFEELSLELLNLRKEKGLLSAGSWTELLVQFLEAYTPPLIYLKLGARFKHFLIDEFQDTNRLQWKALEPLVAEVLAVGGSLLYVGDVKQAIYMWRGGDPSLFQEVPQNLPAEVWSESLHYNFRSARAIVEFNNRFFSRLLENRQAIVRQFLYGADPRKHPRHCPVVEEVSQALAAAFSEVKQKPRPEAPQGEVKLWNLPSEEEREGFRAAVLELLRKLVSDLLSRQDPEETVAILVRENREAEEIAAYLLEQNLPAVTERALRIEGSPLVKGILSLLHFLDYPEDETALAGFLQSPLIEQKFSFEALEKALRKGELKDWLKEEAPEIWDLLRSLSQRLLYLSLYQLVQEIIDLFRLRERFPEESFYLSRFLSAVLLYEEETLGLTDFLARWEEEGGEEKIGLPRELKAVRVFTIHAAKGLEFTSVILPYLTWHPRARDDLVVLENGLFRAQTGSAQPLVQAKLREKGREVLETLNLLYVAFTRAQKRLHIFLPEKTSRYSVGTVTRELLGL